MEPNIHEDAKPPRYVRRRSRWQPLILFSIWLIWTALAMACVYSARSPRLVCLLYHRFAESNEYARLTDADDRVYTISAARFDEQLAALKRLGYQTVTLTQAIDFIEGRGSIPERAVLLTVDDGCRNALWIAEPLLKKHGFSATVFVTTDPNSYVFQSTVPDSERMVDADITLIDRAVWSVGGHGHTHQPLRDMSDSALDEELQANRETLTGLTGMGPVAMAVPGNWQGDNVRAAAARVGYTHVFVSDPGFIRPHCNRQALPRINISGRWSLAGFESAISPRGVAQRKVGGMVKSALSPVIGRTAAGFVSRWLRKTLPAGIGGFVFLQVVIGLFLLMGRIKPGGFKLIPMRSHTCHRPPPG